MNEVPAPWCCGRTPGIFTTQSLQARTRPEVKVGGGEGAHGNLCQRVGVQSGWNLLQKTYFTRSMTEGHCLGDVKAHFREDIERWLSVLRNHFKETDNVKGDEGRGEGGTWPSRPALCLPRDREGLGGQAPGSPKESRRGNYISITPRKEKGGWSTPELLMVGFPGDAKGSPGEGWGVSQEVISLNLYPQNLWSLD